MSRAVPEGAVLFLRVPGPSDGLVALRIVARSLDPVIPHAALDLAARDAIVHFAAVPRILLTPDSAPYATNALSTYCVLASRASIWSICADCAGRSSTRAVKPV